MTLFEVLLLILLVFISFGLGMLRFFICQEVGEFTINVNPEDDVDALYNMNIYKHPSTWKKKKYVRFRVNYKE